VTVHNRELPAGTVLTAKYKKQAYSCTVEVDGAGKRSYLVGEKRFNSPSAASSSITGGHQRLVLLVGGRRDPSAEDREGPGPGEGQGREAEGGAHVAAGEEARPDRAHGRRALLLQGLHGGVHSPGSQRPASGRVRQRPPGRLQIYQIGCLTF
jgi:hypothetical protein